MGNVIFEQDFFALLWKHGKNIGIADPAAVLQSQKTRNRYLMILNAALFSAGEFRNFMRLKTG